jgi:hypothetical protein
MTPKEEPLSGSQNTPPAAALVNEPGSGRASADASGAPPPSLRRLALSVLGALAVAAVVLVLVVLPAEYGIDPTGFGGALGLNGLQEGAEAAGDLPQAEGFQAAQNKPFRSETMTLPIDALEEIEFKFGMVRGAGLVYSWSSEGVPLYFDFHGHPYNDLDGTEVRYEEQLAASDGHGVLMAPYNGWHGWYWRNEGDEPTTITLQVSGHYTHYEEMMRVHFDREDLANR